MFFNKFNRIFALWFNQFFFKPENKRCENLDSAIILKLDALGDFIIWLDCAKEFKHIFQNKKCVLLCNPICKDLAEITNYFDEVITLDIKKFESSLKYRKEAISYMNKLKFGTLVNSVFSRTWAMDIIASEIHAFNKIGIEADESKLNLSRQLLTNNTKKSLDSVYDRLIPSSKDDLMELQRNKELILGLGYKSFESAIPRLPKISSDLVPDFEFFIVFPGASTPLRRWSPDRFAKVINYISSKTDYLCLVCGSKDESFLYDEILSHIDFKEKVFNYCGKTSILDLISLVQNSEFVLSNDTGGIHLAVASSIPGICVGGDNNYGRFLPYKSDKDKCNLFICSVNPVCRNCRNKDNKNLTFKCLQNVLINQRFKCLDDISSEFVINTIKNLIFV